MSSSCCKRDEKVLMVKDLEHKHSKLSLIIYFVGLIFYIIGLFIPNDFVKMILYLSAFLLSGYEVMVDGIIDTIRQTKSHKSFRPNIHILMTLGALGAIIIGEYGEAAILILIFAAAHFLESYVEGKSRREITNLLKLNPVNARLLTEDGTTSEISGEMVQVGQIIKVLNGDQVPLDGIIVSG